MLFDEFGEYPKLSQQAQGVQATFSPIAGSGMELWPGQLVHLARSNTPNYRPIQHFRPSISNFKFWASCGPQLKFTSFRVLARTLAVLLQFFLLLRTYIDTCVYIYRERVFETVAYLCSYVVYAIYLYISVIYWLFIYL